MLWNPTRGRPRLLYLLLVALLASTALLSAGVAIARTLDGYGSVDFHAYWYHSHWLRQGKDPFPASIAEDSLALPIRYLDGTVVESGSIKQRDLAFWPNITAPLLLVSAPFSFFSWPVAKIAWMVVLLIMAAWTPILVIRLFPPRSFPVSLFVVLCLLFFSFRSTRNVVINGQMTLPAFFFMLCALLTAQKRWWLAGLFLGLALSKYSVALPVFLLFLYQRRYRALAVALLVQLIGLLAVSLPFNTSPIATLDAYVKIFNIATGQYGIQVASLYPEQSFLLNIFVALGSLAIFGLIWQPALGLRRAAENESGDDTTLADLHLLSILILWTILVAYHRLYDVTLAFVFITLIAYGLTHRDLWKLSNRERWIPIATLALLFVTQMSARTPPGGLLSEAQLTLWNAVFDRATTVSLLLALGVTVWLYRRLWALSPATKSNAVLQTPQQMP